MAGGRKLTQKQEAFVSAYVANGGNASEAYRTAYETSETWTNNAVRTEACRMMKHPYISLAIKELQDELQMHAKWNRIDSLERLKEVAQGLIEGSKPSDVVAAVKVINQMFGWDKQVLDHQSSDGSMTPTGKSLDDFYADVQTESES